MRGFNIHQLALAFACLLSIFKTADATFVVNCTILQRERIDPIVSPNAISSHQHVIVGSSTISASATNSILKQATCSSCDTSGDMSAYWVPQLYIAPPNLPDTDQDSLIKNGAIAVPQGNGKIFHIYYRMITAKGERLTNDTTGWEEVVPFPEGFRMVVPETMIYNKSIGGKDLNQAIRYKCIQNGAEIDNEYSNDPHSCGLTPGVSLRATLMTPSCWDGVNIDSPNHYSHVSYPTGGLRASPCPASHPKRIPTLVYVVRYDVNQVKYLIEKGWKLVYPKMANQYSEKNVPLFHADFMNGWDQSLLTNVVTQCGLRPCPVLKSQTVCGKTKKG